MKEFRPTKADSTFMKEVNWQRKAAMVQGKYTDIHASIHVFMRLCITVHRHSCIYLLPPYASHHSLLMWCIPDLSCLDLLLLCRRGTCGARCDEKAAAGGDGKNGAHCAAGAPTNASHPCGRVCTDIARRWQVLESQGGSLNKAQQKDIIELCRRQVPSCVPGCLVPLLVCVCV